MEWNLEEDQECQLKRKKGKKRNTCETPSFIAMHVIRSTHSDIRVTMKGLTCTSRMYSY